MELSPLTIGCIGVVALLALCFAGVRFAFAGAIVGTIGLVWMIGWDAGIRTAGIAPYSAGANYTLSVLPMFILIGYLAYYAGITQGAFEAAQTPAASFRSYLARSISGIATLANTAAAALLAPDTAEKPATAKTVPVARPPGNQPNHRRAASKAPWVMPA